MSGIHTSTADLQKGATQLFKSDLRDRITRHLQALDPEQSAFAYTCHHLVGHNFEGLINLIIDQHKADPEGLRHCIGDIPIRLVLKYKLL